MTDRPRRIQMSRQHPWRANHPDAIIVTRGTPYGNPYRIYQHCPGDWGVEDTGRFNTSIGHGYTKVGATRLAIAAFRNALDEAFPPGTSARGALVESLRGRDLACWCPLPTPGERDICHGAVLLELANAVEEQMGES